MRTAKEDTGTGTAGMMDELNSKKDDCECSVTKVTLKNTDLFLGDSRRTTSSSWVLLFLLVADFLGPGFCFNSSGNGVRLGFCLERSSIQVAGQLCIKLTEIQQVLEDRYCGP